MNEDLHRFELPKHLLKSSFEQFLFSPGFDATMRAYTNDSLPGNAQKAVLETALVAPADIRDYGYALLLQVITHSTIEIGVCLLKASGLTY